MRVVPGNLSVPLRRFLVVLPAVCCQRRTKSIAFEISFWFMAPGQTVPAGRAFYDSLVKDGFDVSIVPRSRRRPFQDDVTAVKRILALQGGPSILVAPQLWGSRNYGKRGKRSIGCWPGICRGPHAGCWREEESGRTESAFRATSPKSGCHKENGPTVSRISTRHNFMNCSQLNLPWATRAAFMARSQVLNFCGQFLSNDHKLLPGEVKPSWMVVAGG